MSARPFTCGRFPCSWRHETVQTFPALVRAACSPSGSSAQTTMGSLSLCCQRILGGLPLPDPDSCPQSLRRVDRLLEHAVGGLVVAEGSGKDARGVAERAGEGDDCTVHAATVDERGNVGQEGLAEFEVADCGGGLGEVGDQNRSQIGAFALPASCLGHHGDLASRSRKVARGRSGTRCDRVSENWRARPPLDRVHRERSELVRIIAGTGEGDPLRHQDVAGIWFVDSFADLCGVVHQRLGDLGVTFEQSKGGSASLDHVPVAGLIASFEEPEPAVEHRAESCRTGLEQTVGFEDETLCQAVGVAKSASDHSDFKAQLCTLDAGAGAPEGVVTGEEAPDESRVVVRFPAEGQGLYAERARSEPVIGHRVLEFSRQRGCDLGLSGQIDTGHRVEGRFEMSDDLVAGGRKLGTEPLHGQSDVSLQGHAGRDLRGV